MAALRVAVVDDVAQARILVAECLRGCAVERPRSSPVSPERQAGPALSPELQVDEYDSLAAAWRGVHAARPHVLVVDEWLGGLAADAGLGNELVRWGVAQGIACVLMTGRAPDRSHPAPTAESASAETRATVLRVFKPENARSWPEWVREWWRRLDQSGAVAWPERG